VLKFTRKHERLHENNKNNFYFDQKARKNGEILGKTIFFG